MKNLIKRFLSAVLLVSFSLCLFVNGTTLKAYASDGYDFANITEEESLQFLEDHGIDIPDKFHDYLDIGSFVKGLIQLVYYDPSYEFVFNYDEMLNFANEIKDNVVYYLNNQNTSLSLYSSYSLKYNTVKDLNGNWVTQGGAWNDKWENYNCYAYAINRIEQPQFYSSGSFIQYQPGNMSNSGSFTTSKTIYELATVVKNDLLKMGYTNISLSTTIPDITNNQELICIRMSKYDYHFMKYDLSTSSWYHKPGQSAVLKYNSTPNNSEKWYGEYSANGKEGKIKINIFTQLYYDSDIYFIKYDKNKVDISSSSSNLSYNLGVQVGKDSILEINNLSYNKYYEFNMNATNIIKVELYDKEMELIESYTGANIEFCKSLLNETYYLKLNYVNTNSSGGINISISAHSHTYTKYEEASSGHTATCYCGYTTTLSHVYEEHYCIHCNHYTTSHDYHEPYTWVNYTQHWATCGCGATSKQGHAVSSSGGSLLGIGTRYKTCLLCGGSAEIGFVQLNATSVEVQYVTDNGSYILPNGVIVLVDEDIEAYMNQTLIFQKKNTNLTTE